MDLTMFCAQRGLDPFDSHPRNHEVVYYPDTMSAGVYTIAASYYHWLVAAPLMGSVASVLICQQSPKEEKGKW